MSSKRSATLPPLPPTTMTTLAALLPDRKNARRRTQRSTGMIERSLSEFGAARSVVIDEHGTLLAGNGTAEAAASIGIERVLIVPVDGNTLVAVQRSDLNPEQKAEYGVADNRSSDTSGFSGEALNTLPEEHSGLDLSPYFTDDEFKALISDLDPPPGDKGGGEGASAGGLEVKLRFSTEEDLREFQQLMVRLAEAMPEEETTEARLVRAAESMLARLGR